MSRDRRAPGWVFALATVTAAYALILFVTGGFETQLAGQRIRSRGWERPAVASGALFLLACALSHRRARGGGASVWARIDSRPTARWLTALAIVWALFAGFRYGTFVAGGADSFGYVSQAHLLARGALTDEIPMRPEFTWRDASISLIPLGYRPAAQSGRMAPVYPPGLPLLMLLLHPLGDTAIYAVVPVMGAILLACVAALGQRLGDALAGGIAAAGLSLSATFLLMQFSPMSDIPVTTLWLGALLCATTTSRGGPVLAGVLTGAAVLTRPNLAPLALVIAIALALHHPARLRAAIAFLTPLAIAAALLLWIQWRRYGDPFASGYGPAEDLFALAHMRPNLASYTARITAIYTPVIWLFLVSPVVVRRELAKLLSAALAVVGTVWLCYLPYTPFDAWFFTRFLLPAIPIMLVLAMAAAMTGVRSLPIWMRSAAAIALFAMLAGALARESQRRGVFETAALEQKYRDAGRYVSEHLPQGAYVLARQHSGSVRLYGGRTTIRWDVIGGDQLDFVVSTVRAAGFGIYMVADQDELTAFERHFAGQATPRRLRAVAQFGQAGVYTVE